MSEEIEIQRTDNRFSGYQKCSPRPFEECEPRDNSFDKEKSAQASESSAQWLAD